MSGQQVHRCLDNPITGDADRSHQQGRTPQEISLIRHNLIIPRMAELLNYHEV